MDKSVDCVHYRIAWMCFVSVSRGLRDLGLCYRSSCPDWNSQKWRESSCAHVVQTVIQRICDVLCDMYGLKLWFSECQVLCYMSWTGFESLVAVFQGRILSRQEEACWREKPCGCELCGNEDDLKEKGCAYRSCVL